MKSKEYRKKSPFKWTFEEFSDWAKNLERDVNASQIERERMKQRNPKTDFATDEEFFEYHGLILLEDFLKEMHDKYGI